MTGGVAMILITIVCILLRCMLREDSELLPNHHISPASAARRQTTSVRSQAEAAPLRRLTWPANGAIDRRALTARYGQNTALPATAPESDMLAAQAFSFIHRAVPLRLAVGDGVVLGSGALPACTRDALAEGADAGLSELATLATAFSWQAGHLVA